MAAVSTGSSHRSLDLLPVTVLVASAESEVGSELVSLAGLADEHPRTHAHSPTHAHSSSEDKHRGAPRGRERRSNQRNARFIIAQSPTILLD